MSEAAESISFLATGCDVVLPDRVIKQGAVLAAGGKIVFAGPAIKLPAALPAGTRVIRAEGALACPAFWEPHIHGCGGVSTESMTPQSLRTMAAFLASNGVGGFLPTTVSDEVSLSCLGDAIERTAGDGELQGRVPGIHVEGPFVAASKKGAIPETLIRPMSLDNLDRLLACARKTIKILTFAPELPGAELVLEALQKNGIIPSLGHSDAPYEALRFCQGVSPLGVTHLYNGMSGLSHKDPGLAMWALLNKDVFTELNCDGTHVHDAGVHLALRSRPWEKIVLISDAIAPAGLHGEVISRGDKDAGLSLYGRPLVARGSGLFYADSGVLVGSRFLVRDCIRRLVSEFHVPVAWAVAMASLNTARYLGYSRKGALLPNYDADVALFSHDFRHCSFLSWQGKVLFEAPDAIGGPR